MEEEEEVVEETLGQVREMVGEVEVARKLVNSRIWDCSKEGSLVEVEEVAVANHKQGLVQV